MCADENDLVRLSPTPEASTALAKEYTLDIPRIPSLELPLHVSAGQRSISKAIDMCGGLYKIKRILNERGDDTNGQMGLELYLNEGQDRNGAESYFNEHPIIGKKVPFRDESVILKIRLPKGTLRKHNGNVQEALASLSSREIKVNPVAIVNNTVKFREMSDFQIRLDNTPSANEFKNSFGSMDWANFKKFVKSVPDEDPRPFENISNLVVDRTSKIPSSDFQLPPPPRLSMVNFPFLYKYKTNPFATKKSNGITEVKGTYIKNYQQFVHDMDDDIKVPFKPHELLEKDYEIAKKTGIYPGTKKESKFYESLEKCLVILNDLFEKRPIWVKRHIDGIIEKDIHHTLKIGLALLSYRFTMGPWRNTYIRFAVDPRSSPEYARYQTEYFKIERKLLRSPAISKNIPKPPPLVFTSDSPGNIDSRFKFNGKQIPWYLMLQIDLLVEEPNILEVYTGIKYLEKANELTGWFNELDLVKIRRIVKYELGCMVQGNYKFNEYKLKYFKNMLYVKESMMKGQDSAVDDDIDMDRDSNEKEVNKGSSLQPGSKSEDSTVEAEEDDDNGVATGEADDVVLEAEEADDDEHVRVDVIDEEEEDNEEDTTFDINAASFNEIIDRIAKINPEASLRLQKELNGFINETKL